MFITVIKTLKALLKKQQQNKIKLDSDIHKLEAHFPTLLFDEAYNTLVKHLDELSEDHFYEVPKLR